TRLRRTAVWTIIVMAILVVVGIACEPLVLKRATFRKYVVRAVVQELNSVTGGRVEIASVELQAWPFTAHLHDISLHGREYRNAPPVLHVDEVTVRLSIQSLLKRTIKLDEVLVDHPVLHLVIGDKSNIPQFSTKSAGDHKAGFDLSVGHLLLSNGEIRY